MSTDKPQKGFDDLEPLKVSCKKTNCNAGLHCYQPKHRQAGGNAGPCRTCGVELVEWERVHQRDSTDINYLLANMATEWIRHRYWCKVSYDKEALVRARVDGRRRLNTWMLDRLATTIGGPADDFDWQGTPYDGHVVFYAQHATATCCRACVEEWHGIPPDRALTEREMQYMVLLVNRYFDRFPVPGLTEDGENRKAVRQSLGLPPTISKKRKAVPS